MQEYDERSDAPADAATPNRFPLPVKIAGLCWIVFGTVCLVFDVAIGIQLLDKVRNVTSLVCPVVFALAFLIIGIQTVQGAAKTSLANGVGSIVFSLVYFCVGSFTLTGDFPPNRRQNPNPEAEAFIQILSIVALTLGTMLLTAGVLAVSGNTAYQRWRRAEGLERYRPRRRQDREGDSDDR